MITRSSYFNPECLPEDMIGLSTDTKPTDVANASTFYEMDTKKLFMFDAEHRTWIEQ